MEKTTDNFTDPCRMDFPISGEGKTGYCGVSRKAALDFGEHGKFIVAIYAAFCAYGLYGPENNGIVILNDSERNVVLDRHYYQSTGYHGPSDGQVGEWKRICGMDWDEFRAFINVNSRARYQF